MRRLLPAAALILVLLPSPAQAAESSLDLTSGVPVKLSGKLEASSDRARLYAAGEEGLLTMFADVTRAEVRTVTVHRGWQGLPTGARVLQEERATESRTSLADGRLLLTARLPDFEASAQGTDASYATPPDSTRSRQPWTDANAQLHVLVSNRPLLAAPVAAKLADLAVDPAAAAAEYEFRSARAAAQLTSPTLAWHDGTFEFRASSASQRFESSTTGREAPGSAWVAHVLPGGPGSWVGPGTHPEETTTYHVLVAPGAVLRAASSRTDLALYAASARWTLDGYAGFPWAHGSLATPNGPRSLAGDQTILGGVLDFVAAPAQAAPYPAARFSGRGEIAFLQIGPASEEFPVEAVAAGAGVTAVAAAAAAAYYWPLLKWALSSLLAPLYARVPKERVLDHKGREFVYELVRQEPGVSTNRLAREVPFGWSTLTYHLRVLERNEAIVSLRDGRYRRFFDRESGRFANGRKWVVAALRNPLTLTLARCVLTQPGLTQKELGERQRLAPSTIHWHMERLLDARLVDKRRDGHNVRYLPGPAWKEVQPGDVGLKDWALSSVAPVAAPIPLTNGA